MALHKQVKNTKKKYPSNPTLAPGYNDKMLIHYDNEAKCYRVTHYSRFGDRGVQYYDGLVKTHFQSTWKRVSWTYQKSFTTEIDALNFAKEKAKQRKILDVVFLLQLD